MLGIFCDILKILRYNWAFSVQLKTKDALYNAVSQARLRKVKVVLSD